MVMNGVTVTRHSVVTVATAAVKLYLYCIREVPGGVGVRRGVGSGITLAGGEK